MKIERVTTHLVGLPITTGTTGWLERIGSKLIYVLVRVDTDAGITGWGDAFGYGAAHATKAAVDHMIAPRVIGADPRDIAGLHKRMQVENHLWGRYGVTMFAISGLDIALWDIAGKAAGLPLSRLLGGTRRSHIPCYASLLRYGDPEPVAELTAQAVERGFGSVKLHEIRELEIAAAREAAGEAVPLMVDCNCPWTPLAARDMAARLAPYGLRWLEEPIFPPEDFASLAALQRHGGIPLAAGENACTAYEFKRMIDADAVTFVQPSVTKVGGITEMLRIAALARAGGKVLMPHSPYFGPGLLATLHLLASMEDESLAEFYYYRSIEATFFGDATVPVDGMLAVPEGPGLGHDPDPDVLRDYEIRP